MQRNHIYLLSAVLAGGSILFVFDRLAHPRSPAKPAASANKDVPPPEGPGSKEHELNALQTELEKNPSHAPILLRMAQLARELGRPADAVTHLRKLVAAEPGNAEARLELGRVLYESDDIPGAIAETTRVLDSDPANVDALYNLGAIHANGNQPDRAREYWAKAVAANAGSESGKRAADGLRQLGSQAGVPFHAAKQ